jgi:hypothetical protein
MITGQRRADVPKLCAQTRFRNFDADPDVSITIVTLRLLLKTPIHVQEGWIVQTTQKQP